MVTKLSTAPFPSLPCFESVYLLKLSSGVAFVYSKADPYLHRNVLGQQPQERARFGHCARRLHAQDGRHLLLPDILHARSMQVRMYLLILPDSSHLLVIAILLCTYGIQATLSDQPPLQGCQGKPHMAISSVNGGQRTKVAKVCTLSTSEADPPGWSRESISRLCRVPGSVKLQGSHLPRPQGPAG